MAAYDRHRETLEHAEAAKAEAASASEPPKTIHDRLGAALTTIAGIAIIGALAALGLALHRVGGLP